MARPEYHIFTPYTTFGYIPIPNKKYKYLQRYRSQRVLEEKDMTVHLQHDHVYERSKMVERIMSNHELVEEELRKAIGCVITKNEHDLLHFHVMGIDGWDRYKNANIKVYDMKDCTWII